MKHQSIKSFAFFLLASLFIVGCAGLGKMEKHIEELNAQAEPDPLIVRGDSVEITVSGKFPPKYFHKKVSVEATPVLVYGGQERTFKAKGYQGEDAAENFEVIPFEAGKTFAYSDKVAYDPAMENVSNLELRISGKKGNKTADFDPLPIAQGVITTPYLMQSDDKVIIGADQFERTLTLTKDAVINYEYNKSNVMSKELRDQDIKDLKAFMADASTDDAVTIKSVDIQSYASPEGEISLNKDLADERAASAKKAVANEMKKQKLATDDALFNLVPKGEDWEGFKQKMQASNIDDRDLIVRVLEMYPDKAKREREIKNLAATYREVERVILPQLRRSQIAVTYDIVGYSDAELKQLSMNSMADSLTVEELLYAATLFESLDDKLKIYQTAEKNFTGDYRTSNNVGYILFMQNKVADAKQKFEKAYNANANPVSANNLGIIARLDGDREKALEYFDEAASAGPDVKYNKGLVKIQQGDYSSAISGMSGTSSFNVALAQVLNNDATAAASTLSQSGDDSAMADYLRAIVSARQGDSTGVVSNLQSAVGKDASLGAKAKADLEFRNQWDQLSF